MAISMEVVCLHRCLKNTKGENNFMPLPEKPEQVESEKKTYIAKIICMYCGKKIGEKEGFEEEGLISHSACPECAATQKAELEILRKKLRGANSPKKEE
jgi:hypothetical protein